MKHGYQWLKKQLKKLKKKGANIKTVGKSVLGRSIYAIEIGEGPVILIQYGIHAREYVTCDLAILHAKMLLQLNSCNIKYVLVPMANPDGTELALFGIKRSGCWRKWLKLNFKNFDFSLWKANVKGVDLNNNFDAEFRKHSSSSVPSCQGYCGPYPLSEPETRCLVRLCYLYKPCLTLSFHTKGEEIYFDFFQSHRNRIRDNKIANLFAQDFGYKIKFTQDISSGGFKDWCVSTLGIPSLTIELANDSLSHPIKSKYAKELYLKTKNLNLLCKEALIIAKTDNKSST